MTKRGELKNISKVIEEVFSQKQIRIGIDNIKVQDAWKKTMGKNIQKYTFKVVYRNGTLYVKLKSSFIKEELKYEKHKVIKLINNELGKEYIKDIEIS
jgi:predicted nucleic acid-binding Zn ribbon protein